ncbi:hypothetical protein RB653_004468 [Dictyostelium firmibasis]|uniref:RNA helicase n=1 Tax=Dictyostelium firmibasis TaxID=79012 RepID=A0AAN7TZL9_9MYCE
MLRLSHFFKNGLKFVNNNSNNNQIKSSICTFTTERTITEINPTKNILPLNEQLHFGNKNNKNNLKNKNEFFQPGTTTEANTIKVDAMLSDNIIETSEFHNTMETPDKRQINYSNKIIKISSDIHLDEIQKQYENSKLLSLNINGIHSRVLVDGDISIKLLSTPSILHECGIIDKLPTTTTTTTTTATTKTSTKIPTTTTTPPTTIPPYLYKSEHKPQLSPYFLAFDKELNRIPSVLLIKNLNFSDVVLITNNYALDTNPIKVSEVLKKICKDSSIGDTLKEEDLKQAIELYENDLAISSPKTLFSLKSEPEHKNEILSHFSDFIKKYENDLKNGINIDENNNNNNNNKNFTTKIEEDEFILKNLSDLCKPHEWYPQARKFKRNIILHVGPTNSGKTYRALERLIESESGVYCGPLRLLAHEVYGKIKKKKVECSLLTGQLRLVNPMASHLSCTIEMVSTEKMVEVAVIDEFQMISDVERGHSWTRAILGIPAVELHLCGDNTSVELVKKICEITGDILTINSYERLSELVIEDEPVKWKDIKKGDCLIAFRKKDILYYKNALEREGKKCAIVYGSLPPQTRVEQTNRFNSEYNDVDVLIATDAIGMGLNLNIGRIIFTTLEKFDGEVIRPLLASEVKQIAGRAGRFGTMFPIGRVTAFDHEGLEKIRNDWKVPNIISDRAGIFPTPQQIQQFSELSIFKGMCFSDIMVQFIEKTKIDKQYFICNFNTFLRVAKKIDVIDMAIEDKIIFSLCPINPDNEKVLFSFYHFATLFKYDEKVSLDHKLSEITSVEKKLKLMEKYVTSLNSLETYYKAIDMYLWLANHYPEKFYEVPLAIKLSHRICIKISEGLEAQAKSHPKRKRKKFT